MTLSPRWAKARRAGLLFAALSLALQLPAAPAVAITGFGNGLCLDGADDYADAPDAASLDLGDTDGEDFTLEALFYVPDLTSDANQVIFYKHAAYALSVNFNTATPDVLIFRLWSSPVASVQLLGFADLATGWHHGAAVFDNEFTADYDRVGLYLDGVQLADDSFSIELTPGIANSASPLNVGANTGAVPYDGELDEARLSDTVRYSGAYAVPSGPFTSDAATRALWHFDEVGGATSFGDSSPYGNTLTARNGAVTCGPAGAVCGGLAATLTGTPGDDVLIGTPGDDVIAGLFGNDVIDGGAGDDLICGGAGQDTITGGPGDDLIFGDPGADTVDYSGAPAAVTVNLQLRRATGGHGVDVVKDVENIIGSPHDDTLRGNAKRNVIHAGAGNDGIQGLGGDDDLFGEAGDDNLNGRRGNDLLDGGPGTDQGTFLHAATGVTVDLAVASPQVTGDGTDQLSGIENLLGSRFADTLEGDGGPNLIKGAKGSDNLFGHAGDDELIGNQGFDTGDGGPGTDTCKTEVTFACE